MNQPFRMNGKNMAKPILALFTKETGSKATVLFFLGVFISFWFYVFLHRNALFVHDAMNYWQARYSFIRNEHFSLLNYNSSLRGYFFPLLLFVIQWQADIIHIDSQLVFLTYSALFFAGLTFQLLPWFFKATFSWHTPLIKRLLFSALMFFFWRGHFLYPLTDFPALALLLSGIGILAGIGHKGKNPFWAMLAGLAIGAAVNVRPIYQASLLVLSVLLFFIEWHGLGKKDIFFNIALFFLGVGTILFPQFRINQTHFQKASPFVLSTYIENDNTYEVQLFWGLKTQKYETNIGPDYPFAGVVYRDPLADKIPQRLLRDKTLRGYFNIIRSYPLEVAVSYFRHFFNGLDVFFSTPYVKNIHANHFWLSFLNYLVWFFVLHYSLACKDEKVSKFVMGVVSSILAPVILSVPLVIEVRFFLPLYILAYGIVSYAVNYKAVLSQILGGKFRFVKFVCCLAAWMMICFTLSASTIEQLQ